MNIKIAFYKGHGRLRDKLVRLWTRSPYSHVELVLPDNKGWMGIYPPDSPRVRNNTLNNQDLHEWDFIELRVTEDQVEAILDFYDLTRDQSYDWIGMTLSHILPFRVKHINKWYCSEWVAYALGLSGVVDWKSLRLYNRNQLPPSDLYSILKRCEEMQSNLKFFVIDFKNKSRRIN
jgi:hypothetical protein